MVDYMDPKTLEYGNILLYLKHNFFKKEDEDSLFAVLSCLRDSHVIVPMNATISKEDEEMFLASKVGDILSSHNDIRLKPDILQNGDKFYFPMFSNIEQIPEDYGSCFSTVNLSVLQYIEMAKTYEKTSGLVLDPFTEPLIIEYELADLITKLESRIDPDEYMQNLN